MDPHRWTPYFRLSPNLPTPILLQFYQRGMSLECAADRNRFCYAMSEEPVISDRLMLLAITRPESKATMVDNLPGCILQHGGFDLCKGVLE